MRNKRVCDYIAEAIQNEILSGRMSSGVPLRQEELADSLGYSRIPIREALQILESQGLAKRLAEDSLILFPCTAENRNSIPEITARLSMCRNWKTSLRIIMITNMQRLSMEIHQAVCSMIFPLSAHCSKNMAL